MNHLKLRHAFISFSSTDTKQARALCADMERRGIRCWLSTRDVRPGANYMTEIIEAIRSATHLLLVFSDNACRSGEVARELSLASKYQVRICPVRVQDTQPSGGMEFMLATSQWVDAFRDWPAAMDQLANEVRGPDATVIVRAPDKAPRRSWKLPAAGLAAALLAAAGGAVVLASRRPATAPAALPDPAAIRDAVGRLAATLECARVTVLPAPNDGVALSGFVQSAADRQRLIAAAGSLPLQDQTDIAPWPFCAVRSLGPGLAAADDIAIDINHPDGRYAIGDSFAGGFVVPGSGLMSIQADLIEFDGAVTHLLPAPGRPRQVAAGTRVRFGGPAGSHAYLAAAAPAGAQILLIVATDTPLPAPPRADADARAYLPWLHDALARSGGQLSVSARSLLITPRPGP